jgi:5-(carboxyamino)imidazole ribonucleotide mutase
MKPGLDRLTAMDVPFEILVASAHRTPGRLIEWLEGAEDRGLRVIIAGAGAAAHLPGVVASKTLLPVIGVPFDASPLRGTDALYSIVQMPPGIPVATVGVDSAENAAVLALHILSIADASLKEKLRKFRAAWEAKIAEQNVQLYQEYPMAQPLLEAKSWIVEEDTLPTKEPVKKNAQKSKSGVVHQVDPDNPDAEIIEEAVYRLLDGGIIALPTDTVYGLAVDATNPAAVQKLIELKGREAQKPFAVLIDSMKMFEMLVTKMPEGVEELIDAYWPGALTLIARKRKAALKAVSPDESLGVRMPNNLVALGVINMLARPIAATSANFSGEPPARTADGIVKQFGTAIDMVLDAGPDSDLGASTVLNIMDAPYKILREGPVSRQALQDILGNLLEEA